MIDLGPYAGAVLGAYAASALLLGGLVLLTLRRARKARDALDRIEGHRSEANRDA